MQLVTIFMALKYILLKYTDRDNLIGRIQYKNPGWNNKQEKKNEYLFMTPYTFLGNKYILDGGYVDKRCPFIHKKKIIYNLCADILYFNFVVTKFYISMKFT